MSDIDVLKRHLTSQYIQVPDTWIEACLNHVYSENPHKPKGSSNLWVKKAVYEQWLHADITELGSNVLPFGLTEERCIKINGNFALQVNKIEDIGSSSYSQLKGIQKHNTENQNVMEDKPQNYWEPKPTRTLWLELTDGATVVKGLEYQSIPSLNVNMKPGTKVLLSGIIVVRRGVLFLNSNNIKILGGYTESLAITNALQNILARKLGQPETDNPQELEALPEVPPTQSSQYYPSQVSTQNCKVNSFSTLNKKTAVKIDELDDTDFLDPEMEAVLSIAENSQPTPFKTPLQHSSYQNNKFSSNNNGKKHFKSNNSWPGNSQFSKNQKSTNTSTCSSNINKSHQSFNTNLSEDTDLFGNDSDDDIFLSIPTNQGETTDTNYNSNKRQLEMDDDDIFLQIEPENIMENSFNKRKSQDVNKKKSIITKPTHTAKIISNVGPSKMSTSSVVNNQPPFTYLMFVPENPIKEENFIIKGFVMTLMSKLEQTDGQWKLLAKINDGTKSQLVQIHDRVLSQMIGMTVTELCTKKANAKGNRQELESIMKSVMFCQKKLISLSGLLHITVTPTSKYPFIMNVNEWSPADATRLEERSKYYS